MFVIDRAVFPEGNMVLKLEKKNVISLLNSDYTNPVFCHLITPSVVFTVVHDLTSTAHTDFKKNLLQLEAMP